MRRAAFLLVALVGLNVGIDYRMKTPASDMSASELNDPGAASRAVAARTTRHLSVGGAYLAWFGTALLLFRREATACFRPS